MYNRLLLYIPYLPSSPGNKRVGNAELGSEVTDRRWLEAELPNQTKRVRTDDSKKKGTIMIELPKVLSRAQQGKLNHL